MDGRQQESATIIKEEIDSMNCIKNNFKETRNYECNRGQLMKYSDIDMGLCDEFVKKEYFCPELKVDCYTSEMSNELFSPELNQEFELDQFAFESGTYFNYFEEQLNNNNCFDSTVKITELEMPQSVQCSEQITELQMPQSVQCSEQITELQMPQSVQCSEQIDVSTFNKNDEHMEGIESSTTGQFQIDRAAIQFIAKENQASELQALQGLSVYDQSTLEAGILHQVDQALEREYTHEPQQSAISVEVNQDETELERQIRMGELTPFGTSLGAKMFTGTVKPIDGLNVIKNYLNRQLELQNQQNKRKLEKSKSKKITEIQLNVTSKCKEILIKKRIQNKDDTRKKKRKKDYIEMDLDEYDPWQTQPSPVAAGDAEPDASGSEYVPSNSDYSDSEDDKKYTAIREKPAKQKKRKLSCTKPYKIPEDWASDDSDWEYSDEETDIGKKKNKKEEDDGDIDHYNRRIRIWQSDKTLTDSFQRLHSLEGGLKIPFHIWDKLYTYQRVGVQWLWELNQQRCGGILGDEMGLGKTVQMVAFLAGLHSSTALKDKDTNHRGLGPTLIVCPATVMHQWVYEFHTWYPPLRVSVLHESGTYAGKQRSDLIRLMARAGGVLIVSYTGATVHKKDIIRTRWHYVILDEGHKIRNPDSQITLAVKQIQTPHRIILSGSPMQNNLKELWSLFDFVFPGKLGTLPVFMEHFDMPITRGGYANASQVEVMAAFKCATVLKDSIAPYLLRRMKTDVKSHVKLPEKNEQVLFCRLTDLQRQFYRGYIDSEAVSRILEGRLKVFMGIFCLRNICNHPDLYTDIPGVLPDEKAADVMEDNRYGHWKKSGKMIVVETLLKMWHDQGHRVLVFTQSRKMLKILEAFVKQASYKYLRMDGNTSVGVRQPLINKFNKDTSYFLMLLTTRVGGLGINLTGANRVVIYDPDWNPATDSQARERAWRIGQQQNVTIYRLITAGTIEEKIYHRQIFKQFLTNKVLKDPRQGRFFKSNDLSELFTLKETDENGSTETGAIFAGTGSEIKLDLTKKYKHSRHSNGDAKVSTQLPPDRLSHKKAEKKKLLKEEAGGKSKKKVQHSNKINKGGVSFSDKKIEYMKKLAQKLSQNIVKITGPGEVKTSEKMSDDVEMKNDNSSVSMEHLAIPGPSRNNVSLEKQSSFSVKKTTKLPKSSNKDKTPHKQKGKHKDKRKKKTKDAMFEGEIVPHLVKTGLSKHRTSDDNEDETYATQDEYVLKKLFSKSGLQTALQHDTIMEGGHADYALVEGEADRLAKTAVEKLKESRNECWQAMSGQANFTGLNGTRNLLKKGSVKMTSTVIPMSTPNLIGNIRNRNCKQDAGDPEIELVRDMRDFISSHGGTAKTSVIIQRFNIPGLSESLFRSLLCKICNFHRGPDKMGYWSLKEEFKW